MNFQNDYHKLRFDRHMPVIPQPLMPLGIAGITFTLAWLVIPQSALFWLLLPVVLVLVWLSGYGWRQGLATLIRLLRRLESL